MSHPAASVKSIFSGHMNVDTPEELDPFQSDDQKSNGSLSSKNLTPYSQSTRFEPEFGQNKMGIDSTNGSISSFSDNNDGTTMPPSENNLSPQIEPPTPTLSRNSTTSCLSTTATKDGVEGRKLHRNGPTAYTNTIISNMIRNNEGESLENDSNSNSNNNSNTNSNTTTRSRIEVNYGQSDGNFSQTSFRTTNAEIDGDQGKPNISEPEMSLNTKVDLLSK